MKPFAKVMSFAALSVTTAMVPKAAAKTPPAATPQPSNRSRPQKQQNTQGTANRAKSAATGAAIGAATGHAGRGALIGAGHSRRRQRRANRGQ